jgi:hypothetical protein
MMPTQLPRSWGDIRRDWPLLTAYQRFETGVAFLLTLVIAAVIPGRALPARHRGGRYAGAPGPQSPEHGVFQKVFGDILTVLIALEFNHTLQLVISMPSAQPRWPHLLGCSCRWV